MVPEQPQAVKATNPDRTSIPFQSEYLMNPAHNNYHSYLLRLWQVNEEETDHWHFSLEEVQTRELHGFADLPSLVQFLEELTLIDKKADAILES